MAQKSGATVEHAQPTEATGLPALAELIEVCPQLADFARGEVTGVQMKKGMGSWSAGLVAAIAGMFMVAAGCGAKRDVTSVESTRQALTASEIDRILGFETTNQQLDWSSSANLASSTTASQGSRA
jgi:hypothetical protein